MPRKFNKDKYVGLDKYMAPFAYYEDKLELARKHGFNDFVSFMTELWAQYESCDQIAKIIGHSKRGVRFIVHKMGFKMRGPGKIWPVRFNYDK
jgi:hypothetical protein